MSSVSESSSLFLSSEIWFFEVIARTFTFKQSSSLRNLARSNSNRHIVDTLQEKEYALYTLFNTVFLDSNKFFVNLSIYESKSRKGIDLIMRSEFQEFEELDEKLYGLTFPTKFIMDCSRFFVSFYERLSREDVIIL